MSQRRPVTTASPNNGQPWRGRPNKQRFGVDGAAVRAAADLPGGMPLHMGYNDGIVRKGKFDMDEISNIIHENERGSSILPLNLPEANDFISSAEIDIVDYVNQQLSVMDAGPAIRAYSDATVLAVSFSTDLPVAYDAISLRTVTRHSRVTQVTRLLPTDTEAGVTDPRNPTFTVIEAATMTYESTRFMATAQTPAVNMDTLDGMILLGEWMKMLVNTLACANRIESLCSRILMQHVFQAARNRINTVEEWKSVHLKIHSPEAAEAACLTQVLDLHDREVGFRYPDAGWTTYIMSRAGHDLSKLARATSANYDAFVRQQRELATAMRNSPEFSGDIGILDTARGIAPWLQPPPAHEDAFMANDEINLSTNITPHPSYANRAQGQQQMRYLCFADVTYNGERNIVVPFARLDISIPANKIWTTHLPKLGEQTTLAFSIVTLVGHIWLVNRTHPPVQAAMTPFDVYQRKVDNKISTAASHYFKVIVVDGACEFVPQAQHLSACITAIERRELTEGFDNENVDVFKKMHVQYMVLGKIALATAEDYTPFSAIMALAEQYRAQMHDVVEATEKLPMSYMPDGADYEIPLDVGTSFPGMPLVLNGVVGAHLTAEDLPTRWTAQAWFLVNVCGVHGGVEGFEALRENAIDPPVDKPTLNGWTMTLTQRQPDNTVAIAGTTIAHFQNMMYLAGGGDRDVNDAPLARHERKQREEIYALMKRDMAADLRNLDERTRPMAVPREYEEEAY